MASEVVASVPESSGIKGSAEHFLELMSVFKIPEEIKNDIIYCQRNLRNFIKIQKIVTSKLMGISKVSCLKLLEEIEMEIYEINAEQKYLLLRLKRILEDFYKRLSNNDGVVYIHRYSATQFIGAIINTAVDDTSITCSPISVQKRNNIRELMVKYNLLESKVDSSGSKMQSTNNLVAQNPKANTSRVSLLKPISERVNVPAGKLTKSPESNSNSNCIDSEANKPIPILEENNAKNVNHNHLPTLRLNLLEALNKAKNSAANAAHQKFKQREDLKPKAESIAKTYSKDLKVKSEANANSGSEEQPQKTASENSQPRKLPTSPFELSQELFLQYFDLCSHEHFAHLQQRRSKRIRRPVYNNEKPDFYYDGHIDFDNSIQSENRNKRKTLLLSPPAKCSLNKRKKLSPDVADEVKTTAVTADRSSSSSPNDKSCNECCKTGNEDSQFVKRHTLINQREYLQVQFDAQRRRRRSLMKQSEYYKRKMTQLFNIVQTFKGKKNDT